jgi:cytochrome P450
MWLAVLPHASLHACTPSILTGHETTATTTAAALYCISAHPAVEQQLLAELQGVLGNRPPTYEDLEHLPYLQVGANLWNIL